MFFLPDFRRKILTILSINQNFIDQKTQYQNVRSTTKTVLRKSKSSIFEKKKIRLGAFSGLINMNQPF